MPRQALSPGRVLTMAIFVLSCFGLLLYLWVAFGGSIPLKPKGYRFKTNFSEATSLAREADVRISGVSVGKVKSLKHTLGKTEAVIEMDTKYAPIPTDTRAILRTKTLAGETYVELTPGSEDGPKVPEDGALSNKQVADVVDLDEILSTFDKETRQAWRVWFQEMGRAVRRHGQDINDAFAYLAPFSENATDLLAILDEQEADLRSLVSNGGVVFGALSERDGELSSLITDLNRVFQATARRDRELAETFAVLPTFLDESKATVVRASRFARTANPVISDLRPAVRELSALLVETKPLAPNFKAFIENLDALIDASESGLPALEEFLDDARPLLAQAYPFLRSFNPFIEWLALYKHEITSFLANFAASSQATDISPGRTKPTHYLRVLNLVNAENLAGVSTRLPTNRSNPYMQPQGLSKLGNPALDVFENRNCTGGSLPTLDPDTATDPADLNELIRTFVLDLGPVAPPCNLQDNFTFQGESLRYPHVNSN